MNKSAITIFKTSFVLAIFATLSACGGGGDVAGDSAEFSTYPAEQKTTVFSKSEGNCSGAKNLEVLVTIVGGRPPFRIRNSLPSAFWIDRTEASGKDPVFKVVSLGGCVDPGVITVQDYHSRVATFEWTIEAEVVDAATAIP